MTGGVALQARRATGDNAPGPRGPLVIELVGPAGAGKTAVLQVLRRRDSGIQAGLRIDRLRSLPMITRHAITLAPTRLGLIGKSGRAWRSSLQHLLRLRTLRSLLQRDRTQAIRAIVLDEGPVFSLCRLLLFQRRLRPDAGLPKEWLQEVAQWAGTIDLVVWLDAPDTVLAQRIRDRAKGHEVKEAASREIFQFLERFRDAYREILGRLGSGGRPMVVAIDTATAAPEEVASTILTTIERIERGHSTPSGRS